MTASEIWSKNQNRIQMLQKHYGCDIMVVWENDYKNNKEFVLDKCLTFLNYES